MAWALSASPTCLPNCPASTRCFGFRSNSCPFEPSLCRLRSPLPGNAISRAEKKRQFAARATDQRSQRQSGRIRTPPNRGISHAFRQSPQLRDRTCDPYHVKEAHGVELVGKQGPWGSPFRHGRPDVPTTFRSAGRGAHYSYRVSPRSRQNSRRPAWRAHGSPTPLRHCVQSALRMRAQ